MALHPCALLCGAEARLSLLGGRDQRAAPSELPEPTAGPSRQTEWGADGAGCRRSGEGGQTERGWGADGAGGRRNEGQANDRQKAV